MKTLNKQLKATFLIAAIALGVMFGGAQQSKAAYYDNYHSYFNIYIADYNSTGNPYYLYTGYAFLYYYWSGFYGDYYAWLYDPYGDYSDKHLSSSYYSSYTYDDIYYNYFASLGDYLWRVYNFAPSR